MRVRSRLDANHRAIVEGLRDMGCSVLDLSQLGSGIPDILVGVRGQDHLLEIKSLDANGRMSEGAKRSSARQMAWGSMWRGHPVRVVSTLGEALSAVGVRVGSNRGLHGG